MPLLLNSVIILFFILTATVTILIPHLTSWAFVNCSYYMMLVLVAAWALSLWRLWPGKERALAFIKTHRHGILFSIIFASFIFISVPCTFRILADETNTLSVAKSLVFNKRAENVTEGRWYYNMFWPSNSIIDKRPLLFPFLVSLLDTFLGYRPENAFLLNYLALALCLFQLYLFIRSSLSELLAFTSIILVMSQPFMSLTATTSSLEILNLAFILSSFLSLKAFIDHPDRKYFSMLCLNLLMLSNVRYESFIFLAVIMGCLAVLGYLRFEFFKSGACALMLFLCLPLIWQRVIFSRIPDFDMPNGLWVNAFSFKNAGNNLLQFLKYALNIDGHLGFAGIVNVLGMTALCYGAFRLLLNIWSVPRNNRTLLACCSASLLAFFITILCYNQARMIDHPLNGRLYMPVLVTLSLFPVFVLNDLFKNNAAAFRLMMVGAMSLFIFYNPVAEEGRVENQLVALRDFHCIQRFLKANAEGNPLLIYCRPGEFVIYNYGAISFSAANQQKDAILNQYQNRLFSKIYVVQRILYENKMKSSQDRLYPSYHLQTISEAQTSSSYLLRISEVVLPK